MESVFNELRMVRPVTVRVAVRVYDEPSVDGCRVMRNDSVPKLLPSRVTVKVPWSSGDVCAIAVVAATTIAIGIRRYECIRSILREGRLCVCRWCDEYTGAYRPVDPLVDRRALFCRG